jgi:hypothetical protein
MGAILIMPSVVSATTIVTISVTGGGVTRSADLTVNPVNVPLPPPPIASLTVSPSSVVGGTPSTGTVTLATTAPTGGTVVALGSQLPGLASVPSDVTVPAGATRASFPVTTFASSFTTVVQLSATLGGSSQFATITVGPASTPTPPPPPTGLTAPSLVSPASDAQLSPGRSITFDWTDVTGAASYTIQIDDDDKFSAPAVVAETVSGSQFATSTLPSRRMWWRVRAISSSGTAGPWSSVRRFEVK